MAAAEEAWKTAVELAKATAGASAETAAALQGLNARLDAICSEIRDQGEINEDVRRELAALRASIDTLTATLTGASQAPSWRDKCAHFLTATKDGRRLLLLIVVGIFLMVAGILAALGWYRPTTLWPNLPGEAHSQELLTPGEPSGPTP